jgi:Chaperone of endosialidase
MIISYSKLFVGISLPALCTGLASLLLSISADAQTIRPSTQKELKVFDPTAGNSGNIGIRAAAGTLSYTLTMPAAIPTANQVLSSSAVTGGNVTLTWATPFSGTGTTNYLAKFATAGTLTNSLIFDNGTSVGIGTITPTSRLQVTGNNVTTSNTLIVQDGGSNNLLTIRNDGYSLFGPNTSTSDVPVARFFTQKFGRNNGLQLYAGGTLTNTSGDYIAIFLQDNNKSAIQAGDDNAGRDLLLNPAGGNVGIGIIAPTDKVSITNGRLTVGFGHPQKSTLEGGDGFGSALRLYENNVENIRLNANGNSWIENDRVGIGTATPRGKLDVMDGDLILTDIDVSQPATSYADTKAFGRLKPLSDVNGGLDIWGLSDTDATAMRLIGIMGSSNPTDATPAILFRGDKLNSAESQSLSATETVFQFSNFTNPLVTILGSGNVGIGTTIPTLSRGIGLHILGNGIEEGGATIKLSDAGSGYGNFEIRSTRTGSLNRLEIGEGSDAFMTFIGDLVQARGFVGIGTTNPGHQLDVSGDINITGSYRVNGVPQSGTSKWTSGTGDNIYKSSGNVGIGTTNPGSDKLQINESTNADLNVSLLARGGNSRYAQINFGVKNSSGTNVGGSIGSSGARGGGLILQGNTDPITDGNAHFFISLGGETRLRASSSTDDKGSFNLQVNETGVWAAGPYTNGSDSTLKKNIKLFSFSTEVLKKLRPVTYKYKSSYNKDTTIQAGFIAQEVQEALKSTDYVDGVVKKGSFLSIAYQSLIPLLTKALQESIDRIELLEKKISILEQKAVKN